MRFSRRIPALLLGMVLAWALACTGNVGSRSLDETHREELGATAWRYALVLDASSSATNLFIYRWRPGGEGRLPRIEAARDPAGVDGEIWEKRVRPGLSDYAGRPEDAARSLAPLLDYALEKIDDPAARRRAPVHLWATAGLRLLPEDHRSAILKAVEDHLTETPFGEATARVISGAEEGVFGWLAVNYLLGHLEHGGPFPTVGALDLGGASTQITFVPLDHPREHGQLIRLGDNAYHLYTRSYLGLGQDQAREKVASPACFLRDYPLPGETLGEGDWNACRRAIQETLFGPCPQEPCSGLGSYQPPVYGDFLAFSVYAYTADFFGLRGRLSPQELERRAAPFCASSWPELAAADPEAAESPFVPRYCFAAAYVYELLTTGLGFPAASERIQAPLRVQGVETGWALGALLYELAGDAD